MYNGKYDYMEGYVLIETLWNVKIKANPSKRVDTIRINRNIVECKGM